MVKIRTFITATCIRAIKTMCQTAVSMFAIGSAFTEVNWPNIISVSVVAGIFSILTSIATGLPETEYDGIVSSKKG